MKSGLHGIVFALIFFMGCVASVETPVKPSVVNVPAEGEYAVLRVVDGDTLDIGVKLADGSLLRQRVRLLNVYAPERGEELYAKAKADLERLAGNRVRITYAGKRKRGKYGRLLGTIWQTKRGCERSNHGTTPDKKSINQQMRDLGWINFGRGRPSRSELKKR